MITSSHVVFRSQTNNTDNTNVCFPFYVSPALSQLASSQTCADYYQYKEIFSILSFSLCSTLQIIDTYSKKTELLMIQYPAPQVRPVGIFSTLFLKYQRHNIVDNRCIFKNDRMVDDICSIQYHFLASSYTFADYQQYLEIFSILSISFSSTQQIVGTYSFMTKQLMIQYLSPLNKGISLLCCKPDKISAHY